MVLSASHLLATRNNLRTAHERLHDKQLWEDEHGTCRRCKDDIPNPASCNECINGRGKKDLFREKPRRRKLRSAVGGR